jgi:hypothetical protein
MANEFLSYSIEVYLEPSTENILGFIAEEAVKQMTGYNRKDNLEIEIPGFLEKATAVTSESSPISVKETVELNEPLQVNFALSLEE